MEEDHDNEPPASPVHTYKESFSTALINNDEDDDDDIFPPKPAITSYVHFPLMYNSIFCLFFVLLFFNNSLVSIILVPFKKV